MNNVVPDEVSAFGLENEEDEWLTDDIKDSSRESHRTVDCPWSVTQEARLIVDCKDISDEPGIVTTVFKPNRYFVTWRELLEKLQFLDLKRRPTR